MPELTPSGVDFDDEEVGFQEEGKTGIKARTKSDLLENPHLVSTQRENEKFWVDFAKHADAVVGTCIFALQEVARPEPKEVKGTAMPYTLRIGDIDQDPETSIEIAIKATKGTALVRPPSAKKFAIRAPPTDDDGNPIPVIEDGEERDIYAPLKIRTEYALAKDLLAAAEAAAAEAEARGESPPPLSKSGWSKSVSSIPKESLTKSFKYGATWVDVEGEFEKLDTRKGIDICAFFPAANVSWLFPWELHLNFAVTT
jgi:ATP-dependent DNA helicase 2 subunit 2